MLRVELATQLRRVRSLILLGVLAGIPVLAGVTEASKAGGRGGAATFSALNFAESGLNFMDPVLFGLIIAVFGSILGGADRDWGTLRYLYVRPVSRRRLMAGKWWALVICSALAIATFLVVTLLTGVAVFGWHPFHRGGTGDMSPATATWAILGAGGYLTICLLSIGSIALALGLLLPRSVEALGISVAFVVGSALLDNVPSLHAIIVILPVHYWLRWTQLFDGGGGGLVAGLVAQLATVVVVLTAAYAILSRRDPAA
ncbi:MAG TPA: ABC transporter permease [Streptosporangiaceae bacterium]|jgi:ABC-2 type transport system permease protein